ncbi:Short-chain dehydrogenase TIC 32, chloroplastic [Gossypium arboreum]|uniref:Short-chain dehydrogenase TIC 32, chloroplastic n=1 Tax=Gossypium arboreum TaxID=29729 RepID=A0A0B0M8L6_GOSAR|nr:Short-chain dehydrogenase TIC 32, chloroplastic [Gossypium arboreum]
MHPIPLISQSSSSFVVKKKMVGVFRLVSGYPGPSGFGSASTAQEVTEGIDGTNLTALVTGGASGIGLETSRVLALRGVHVIIGARNMKAANEAKNKIVRENTRARIDVLELDLCSTSSIRAFADNFIALHLPLNILINNAGIMFCPFQLSQDGIEVQLATNHIGHFLLTNLLLDTMKNTVKATGIQGRIVNLSSIAHHYCYYKGIRFHKINHKQGYSEKRAYGQSKLANILHANELSRRLQVKLEKELLKFFSFFLWKNVPQGAATTCYVALHPRLNGVTGKYFADCNEMRPSSYARNESLGRELWEFSNKLISSVSEP